MYDKYFTCGHQALEFEALCTHCMCSDVSRQNTQETDIEANALLSIIVCLQVVHAPFTPGVGMSFRNTWLRSLGLRLPTLALAVDDSLAAFAARVAAVLAAQRSPPAPPPQVK